MTRLPEDRVEYYALAPRVLAVAKWNDLIPCPDWAAYIDAVPGENHRDEWKQVTKTGQKLPREVARLLFPNVDAKYTWRA